tara:strand:- start:12390 stop:12593 length:204 start_codon:yes stop_codon:yes gene_type:complete
MENYIDYYLELISPKTIIGSFKSDLEFQSWCETRSKEYLKDLLEDFERHEEYLHCAVIFRVLKAIQK